MPKDCHLQPFVLPFIIRKRLVGIKQLYHMQPEQVFPWLHDEATWELQDFIAVIQPSE